MNPTLAHVGRAYGRESFTENEARKLARNLSLWMEDNATFVVIRTSWRRDGFEVQQEPVAGRVIARYENGNEI